MVPLVLECRKNYTLQRSRCRLPFLVHFFKEGNVRFELEFRPSWLTTNNCCFNSFTTILFPLMFQSDLDKTPTNFVK